MKKVNFGFQVIEERQKQDKVQKIFSDVAKRYDLMNDIMSLGLHRIWKNRLMTEMIISKNDTLLDIAGGTGDIAERFLKNGGKNAIICDLNKAMLEKGEDQRIDKGLINVAIETVWANAEELPFDDNSFDFCAVSFGIRNMTNIDKVLLEARRILKPGGKFLCLEFSQIDYIFLQKLYDFYSFKIIPKIGRYVTGSSEHYRYLSESIRLFPQAAVFARMLKEAGFDFVKYLKLSFGIVAIHSGYKV